MRKKDRETFHKQRANDRVRLHLRVTLKKNHVVLSHTKYTFPPNKLCFPTQKVYLSAHKSHLSQKTILLLTKCTFSYEKYTFPKNSILLHT